VKFKESLTDTTPMAKDRQSAWWHPLQPRWIVALTIVVAVVAIFLSGEVRTDLGTSDAFLPAMLAVVACAQGLTALLLFQKFLAGGRGHLVGIAAAYLFASLITVPHALTFPGLISQQAPFGNSSSTTWFWIVWHVAFPALLLFALATRERAGRWTVNQKARIRAVCVASGGTALGVVLISAVLFGAQSHLPTLTTADHQFTDLLTAVGFWVLGANVVATAAAYFYCRETHGTLAWVPVVALTMLADVSLTVFSEARYTLGWYGGRTLSFLTANLVLAALITEFARLYGQSEAHRRALEDEALDLLRDKRAALYREDRVRRVIENAADAYIEINRHGQIQAWNGKAVDMFGWRNVEVEGKRLVELIMANEGWEQFRALLEEFWESPDRFDGSYAELLVTGNGGVEFPVEATLWVDESDFDPRMSFFLRDITMRRETQEKLQKALKEEREAVLRLQEIDRVKSNFVSSVSHELRSPLTSTLGYLELLADGDAGALTEHQLNMVHVAQRNAARLFSLIEDLLILSRVEEGAFSVRFRAVPMRNVLDSVRMNNSHLAAERNVDLTFDVDPQVGVCPGDAQQLTRALSNIVNNAVKFCDSHGRVEVTARQQNNEIELVIKDNGIGIPVEEQNQLFDRFFRTSISVAAEHQGAGLGLTISKTIIDHHAGTIDVSSQLGKGTTVTVRLPATQPVNVLVTDISPA
jgi:PAS domain S-box-containing protein